MSPVDYLSCSLLAARCLLFVSDQHNAADQLLCCSCHPFALCRANLSETASEHRIGTGYPGSLVAPSQARLVHCCPLRFPRIHLRHIAPSTGTQHNHQHFFFASFFLLLPIRGPSERYRQSEDEYTHVLDPPGVFTALTIWQVSMAYLPPPSRAAHRAPSRQLLSYCCYTVFL